MISVYFITGWRYLYLQDFPDTTTLTGSNGMSQYVGSAMILPLVVWSSQVRSFDIEVGRVGAGQQMYIGRPIVLGGIVCSWAITH